MRPENGPPLPLVSYLLGTTQLQSLRSIPDLRLLVLLGVFREHRVVGVDRNIPAESVCGGLCAGKYNTVGRCIGHNRSSLDWIHRMAPVPLYQGPNDHRMFRENALFDRDEKSNRASAEEQST